MSIEQRNHRRSPLALAVALVALTGVASAVADPPASELDRKLFEPAGAGQGSAPASSPMPGPPIDARRLDRELGNAAISEDEQPLVEVVRQMRSAEQRILRGDCGPQTQQSQQQILADLDRLIRQARSQGQASAAQQSSSMPAPHGGSTAQANSKPGDKGAAGRRPGDKPGSGTALRPTPQQLEAVFGQAWGQLPAQARQQLLQQWSAEQFLPEYAPMIEQYFRRLTEAQEDRR
jgi:hypothetical protein